jgi:hypothetical protein
MQLEKWLRRSGLGRDECELYCGWLIILIFGMALIGLQ